MTGPCGVVATSIARVTKCTCEGVRAHSAHGVPGKILDQDS